MTTQTGNFAELLWPGLRETFGVEYKRYKPIWSRTLRTLKSDKAFEKFQGLAGLGTAAIKDEGGGVTYVDPLQGYQKEAVNVTYGLGVVITREMMEDDQYNFINRVPGMLAESMRQTEEIVGTLPWNNGFSTATTADGSAFFSATHPLVGGGTFSNIPSVATDLSQAALEAAHTDIEGWVDDRNLRIMVMPKKLLVAPANRWVAEKILKTSKEVGSNDNTINPMEGVVELIVNPYLTDPDAWFLITDNKGGEAAFIRRRSTEYSKDNDFDSENLKSKVTSRFTVTQIDPRYAWASAGA